MSTVRIGIFGGTFDPIHRGHLAQAKDALMRLHLDVLFFVPARQSPHKPGVKSAAARHRVAMVKKTIGSNPHFWVSITEVSRPGPSYAIQTVLSFKKAFPTAKYFYLIGADQLPKLHTWKKYSQLKREVTFVVLPRENVKCPLPRGVIRLPKARQIDVSATQIRHRVKERLPIDRLVPAPVAAYIRKHKLYRP